MIEFAYLEIERLLYRQERSASQYQEPVDQLAQEPEPKTLTPARQEAIERWTWDADDDLQHTFS